MPEQSGSGLPRPGRFMLELILALILVRLPFISIPFQWLESFFHELSHGLATVISGGVVSHIQLFPNGAGYCFSAGGWPVLIGFSGYFGAALWGYLMYQMATRPAWVKVSYGILTALVALTTILWARDLLTLIILIALGILFLAPLRFAQSNLLMTLLRVMALMVMLNALTSPFALMGLEGKGDAQLLSSLTWIPGWIWISIWLVCSALALYFTWRRVEAAQ
ncbi:M50 family metallopeptidase [Shewanella submarina]|uniref:M50 family metallopeptidase n=1 Tax=Shewanella submarina TaxID=2016376 RepID=A0ABV7GJU8_9GAMM|nr:M50 family metallopeptidase [Shewanella submarina]MCL1039097.1 M50 family metallopeptidase [Shewanella submarina]